MIAIVDCNNFYASCERVFNPKLEGRPVVVLSNNDGCIIARSNEAKALGIEMAMPAFQIEPFLQKHHVAVFSSNYVLYGDLSERVMNTLATLVKEIEIYSIDEAFIDLSGYREDLTELGFRIRRKIKQWTGIPVSVGIAPSKTLAKVANKIAKKSGGVHLLADPESIRQALEKLPVKDIWGIGGQYSKFLKSYGILTALDLTRAKDAWIQKHMTLVGLRLVKELRGESCIELDTEPAPKKAIGTARSFGQMLSDFETIAEALANYAATCARKLRQQQSCANMLTVFLETHPFKEDLPQYFNSKVITLPVATNYTPEIVHYAKQGLKAIFKKGYQYKKTGVIVSGLVPEDQVQRNFFDEADRGKQRALMKVMDAINDTMGKDRVRLLAQGYDRKWKLRQERLTPCYTSRWEELLTIDVDKK